MTTLLYDGSFEGFLTGIFEAYDRKLPEYCIRREDRHMSQMFSDVQVVTVDRTKANRVLNGLRRRMTRVGLEYLYYTSFSELPEAEDVMQAFITHILSHKENAEQDFSNASVLRIARIAKMVSRERHRMKAFVRFQLTKDGMYYAAIEPDFNVIPLIISHFRNRYADQRWLIYDVKRKYGIYYNLDSVETVTLQFEPGNYQGKDISISFDETEPMYQQLWQQYFKSVNIASRRNMTLHLRHVPRRYWGFLTEKTAR